MTASTPHERESDHPPTKGDSKCRREPNPIVVDRRLKLHRHDGVEVEIRPGPAAVAILRAGPTEFETAVKDPRPDAIHREEVARSVRTLLGSLLPQATVTVTIAASASLVPTTLARAVYLADAHGADLPRGVPPGAHLTELPCSQVCVRLGVAGRLRWIAPVDDAMVQIYDAEGRRFSVPVLRSDAAPNPSPPVVGDRHEHRGPTSPEPAVAERRGGPVRRARP
ncbi:hypothetical protein Q5424_01050 [Conexibacter sp. JD483]|uniref:hypothetical protein n=1 Tax=unclassified Conexibacter TaxID=2627773 RepID=UPI0027171916|nr:MULTISPECIES: hypothetical protein [unclassified Conexibacter]MDO8185815.1 hypothetical protein [Conexibacter sp. CPCC 205706]MDO8198559.1 hypothetical protein [Conexibacter sp. CPCC 205762]MDR9367645.1 hypothetical protein [Conexibacter sp. JD483]